MALPIQRRVLPVATVHSILAKSDIWTRNILCYVPHADISRVAIASKTTNDLVKEYRKQHSVKFMEQTDIWVNHILPFLGMGQYAYIGAASKKFNEHYKAFCDSVETKPLQRVWRKDPVPATPTCTFLSAAFYNIACTEFWFHKHYKYPGAFPHIWHVNEKIAQHGNCKTLKEVLKWSYTTIFFLDREVFYYLGVRGFLHIIQWAIDEQLYDTHLSIARGWTGAAAAGHFDIIKWAYNNGYQGDHLTCAGAAEGGHLEILQFLRVKNCPWNEETCSWASAAGKIECLQWARRNGCAWDEDTCTRAAENGHLGILRWCHENGCPWNGNTTYYAALHGKVECLRYAYEQGCPLQHRDEGQYWTNRTRHAAAMSGNLDCVKYFLTIPGQNYIDEDFLAHAYHSQHWSLLEWLTLEAGRRGDSAIVKHGIGFLQCALDFQYTTKNYYDWDAIEICNAQAELDTTIYGNGE